LAGLTTIHCIYPKNAFIDVGLFFENRQEARKLGLLPPGKSLEAGCEGLEPQERKKRVFKGQLDINDFNCIIRVYVLCFIYGPLSSIFHHRSHAGTAGRSSIGLYSLLCALCPLSLATLPHIEKIKKLVWMTFCVQFQRFSKLRYIGLEGDFLSTDP
jgi:hypothetical protein